MKHLIISLIFLCAVQFSFAQNQNISKGIFFDGEPYLSINPNNSQNMVVAWMGFEFGKRITLKTKVTFDGGKTWSKTVILPHIVSSYTSADPTIDFDKNGNVFLAYIDFSGYGANPFVGGIYLTKSIDGGKNWGTPVQVLTLSSDSGKLPIDRPWLSVDKSTTATKGNIYITSMNAKGASAPFNPYLSVSTNGGVSFKPWRYLDSNNWMSGSLISQPMPTNCVASDGTFYGVFPSYVISQNFLAQYIIASSKNGGKSLKYNSILASKTNVNDKLAKKGYLIRSNPADSKHLAFFYLDKSVDDADVFMVESKDGGNSWSTPLRINDDPIADNKMQDLLWADFDLDGDLVVSWRDRRNGSTGYSTSTEIWGAVRLKDSSSFSPNFKISDKLVSHDKVLEESGNDFMCIKLQNDTLNAVWGDVRSGKLNIWFQRMALDGKVLSVKSISSENVINVQVFPNPSSSLININGKRILGVNVYNSIGKIVLSMNFIKASNEVDLDIKDLPKGVYLFHISTENGVVVKRILKE